MIQYYMAKQKSNFICVIYIIDLQKSKKETLI